MDSYTQNTGDSPMTVVAPGVGMATSLNAKIFRIPIGYQITIFSVGSLYKFSIGLHNQNLNLQKVTGLGVIPTNVQLIVFVEASQKPTKPNSSSRTYPAFQTSAPPVSTIDYQNHHVW